MEMQNNLRLIMLKPKTPHLGFVAKVFLLLVLCFPLKAMGQTADPSPPILPTNYLLLKDGIFTQR